MQPPQAIEVIDACGEPSILLVDDDAEVRELLSELLVCRGYAVTACANGADALAFLEASLRPSLILLDLQMPVMDGYSFRDVQSHDPRFAEIPVVVISDQVTVDRSRIVGTELLPKPFKVSELVEVIERHR